VRAVERLAQLVGCAHHGPGAVVPFKSGLGRDGRHCLACGAYEFEGKWVRPRLVEQAASEGVDEPTIPKPDVGSILMGERDEAFIEEGATAVRLDPYRDGTLRVVITGKWPSVAMLGATNAAFMVQKLAAWYGAAIKDSGGTAAIPPPGAATPKSHDVPPPGWPPEAPAADLSHERRAEIREGLLDLALRVLRVTARGVAVAAPGLVPELSRSVDFADRLAGMVDVLRMRERPP
jgi:hypothetical protein